tara:strand:+ start:397 stop:1173 length:777 start_codon:yes stop_codon:yes gene_type:complete
MTLSSVPQSAEDATPSATPTSNEAPAKHKKPGRIMPAAGQMHLATKIGHQMWEGRRSSGQGDDSVHSIVGAMLFAKNCSEIWRAATANDPYADNALLEIELAYQDADKAIDIQIASLTELIETGMPGITLTAAESIKPLAVDLSFQNPWGYRGAALVKKFDDLAQKALTAKSVGLMFDGDWQSSVFRTGTRVRRTFDLSRLWVNTGVTRDDIKANNEIARRAIDLYTQKHKDKMLAIDERVLTGELRARLSPHIGAGG